MKFDKAMHKCDSWLATQTHHLTKLFFLYIWEGGVTDINMKFLAAETLKIQRAVLFSKDGLTYHNRWSWIFTFEIFDNK